VANNKNQHYVPMCYLKSWCDPATPQGQVPYVWIYDRDGANPKRKAPKNIFSETDLYTVVTESGTRNLVLESGLAQLESAFASLRDTKIAQNAQLSEEDRFLFCVFTAAAHARTIAFRDSQASQWGAAVRKMEDLKSARDSATPEERAAMDRVLARAPSDCSISYEQAQRLEQQPLQNMMLPVIQELAPLLMQIDLAFLRTPDPLGFITSDSPCTWFDPEAYKRPPMYRQPILAYKSIQIILPVSPSICAMFNRQSRNGYFEAQEDWIDEMNRITRFSAYTSFVVNRCEKKEVWFDPGEKPADSWESRNRSEDSNL